MPITDNTSTPPPKKTTAGRPVRSLTPAAITKARTDALTGLGQLAQVPLIATRQFADAGAVSLYWPNISQEIAKLADESPQIAKIIDPLMQVGPYAGLITAVLPFVLQIAVNHGRVAAGAMGTVPGSALSAQVESSLAQAELEALRTQAQAEKEAAAVRDEINASRKALADQQAASA